MTAASAAICAGALTHETIGSCRRVSVAATSGGATQYPTRQPVMAYTFENEYVLMMRGLGATRIGLANVPSNVISS